MSFLKKMMCVGLLLALHTSSINASCSYCGCSVETTPLLGSKTGQWVISLGMDYSDQNKPYINADAAITGQLAHHHDEQQTLTKRYSIGIAKQLSDSWQLGIELPFVSRYHRHIHNHHGEQLFEVWQLGALGDLWLNSKYQVMGDNSRSLSLLAGVKLPTGGTRLTNADGDEAEVSIQPGSGSYDTRWGIAYQDTIGLPIKTSILVTTNGNGTDGWKNGNQFAANLGTSLTWLPNIAWTVQCNALVIEKSQPGTTREDVSSTGGTYVFLTPGIDINLTETTLVSTQVQIPLYRYVNDIQLAADVSVKVGLQTIL